MHFSVLKIYIWTIEPVPYTKHSLLVYRIPAVDTALLNSLQLVRTKCVHANTQ